jgi:hypothetical protein
MSAPSQNINFKIKLLSIMVLVLIVMVSILFYQIIKLSTKETSLSLEELKITDSAGTVRVILSGDVPDPVINGKTLDRGNTAAGIILFDKDGQERSGYLTFDEGSLVGLTLDSKTEMQARFIADPEGVVSMKIWTPKEKDTLELRADSSGTRMTTTKGNDITAQVPELEAIPAEVCELFKGGIKTEVPEGLPRDVVKNVCSSRFPEELCLACLPEK